MARYFFGYKFILLVSIKIKFQACDDKSCLPPEGGIGGVSLFTGLNLRGLTNLGGLGLSDEKAGSRI